ncbi:MAG: ATP-binding protein [Planctomycetaceae bacterium]
MPPEPIYLYGDSARLTQVVGNLLNNACKFSDTGSRIWLTVEVEEDKEPGRGGDNDKEKDASIPLSSPPRVLVSHALIRVRDSDIGIAPEQLHRIFEIFVQLDTTLERSISGLGIGLALVKNLVEMHGGTVKVRSEGLGKGSEFVIRLPIMVRTSTPPQSKSILNAPVNISAQRILVVDDNRDSAITLTMLLKLQGNETQTAFDGVQELEAAATFRPDVILLDIGLPRLNGYEVARKIREQPWGRTMVLVALTGWGQDEDRRKSSEAGFNGHMVKPVDHAALAKLLAELVPSPA